MVIEKWKYDELGNHATLYVPMRDKPKKFDGDIPWLRIEDLDGKYVSDSKSNQYVSNEIIKKMNLVIFPVNTVLCSCSATIGVCAITTTKLITNQTFIGIHPNSEIDSQFLYYYLQSQTVNLIKIGSGSTILYISRETFEKFKIPILDLNEQKNIVNTLSEIDTLIDSLESLIQKKKNIKQGTMQELLTGKRRLEGFSGEWEILELGKLGLLKSGNGFPEKYQGRKEGEIPFYKVSDLNNLGNEVFMKNSNNYISKEIQHKLKTYIFPTNSIVFAKIGAAIFLERKRILTQKSCLDNNLMGIVVNTDKINLKFLYYVLLNISLGKLVEMTALPSISTNNIEKLTINFPFEYIEQEAISKILSDMDSEIEQLESQKEKYINLKQAMMQKLLTGEIRLV